MNPNKKIIICIVFGVVAITLGALLLINSKPQETKEPIIQTAEAIITADDGTQIKSNLVAEVSDDDGDEWLEEETEGNTDNYDVQNSIPSDIAQIQHQTEELKPNSATLESETATQSTVVYYSGGSTKQTLSNTHEEINDGTPKTYEDYCNLSREERISLRDSFESLDAYIAWVNDLEAHMNDDKTQLGGTSSGSDVSTQLRQ